jgi:hypothetical protein
MFSSPFLPALLPPPILLCLPLHGRCIRVLHFEPSGERNERRVKTRTRPSEQMTKYAAGQPSSAWPPSGNSAGGGDPSSGSGGLRAFKAPSHRRSGFRSPPFASAIML